MHKSRTRSDERNENNRNDGNGVGDNPNNATYVGDKTNDAGCSDEGANRKQKAGPQGRHNFALVYEL